MAFPQLLSYSSGSSPSAATTHTLIYPSGTQAGDLLILIAAAPSSAPSVPAQDFVGNSTTTPTNVKFRYAYRYANGSELGTGSQTETSSDIVNFTTTTTATEKVSYVVLRYGSGSIVNGHRLTTANGTNAVPTNTFRGGNEIKDYTVVNALAIATSSAPSAVSTGYTFAASQSGATDAPTIWVQTKQLTSTANTTDTVGAQTLSQNSDMASVVLSVALVSQSTEIYQARLDNDFPTSVPLFAFTATSKYVGQTFAGDGSRISRIGVNTRKSSTGTPIGLLTCSIYLMTGSYAVPVNGYPSGSAIATSSNFINAANLDTTTWQYEEFIFNPPYRTDSEQYYVAIVESPGFTGGTVYLGGSSGTNNTWTGNAVTSSDGVNWLLGNDLYIIQQKVSNDTQYYLKSGFESASITSNKFEGWYSVDPTYIKNNSGIRNINIASASSQGFVSQSIVYDSTAGKNVYAGWSIKDDAATTTTNERAQIGIDFWDDPNQWTEFKARTRMKLHSDWNYLWQNFTGSIGTGSAGTGAWNGWIVLSETWLQDASRTGLVVNSNTAGSAKWSLDLAKASASLASPANLFWKIRGDLMAPTSSEDTSLWAPDNTQSSLGYRYNRTVPVPIDEWFWLEYYFKKGSGSIDPNAGRVTLKIETTGAGIQTIFDIKETTQYVSASTYLPQIMQGSFNPVKVYASSSIYNFMSGSGKKFEIRVSDFEWYNLSYPTAGSFSININNFAGLFTLTNYKWIPT